LWMAKILRERYGFSVVSSVIDFLSFYFFVFCCRLLLGKQPKMEMAGGGGGPRGRVVGGSGVPGGLLGFFQMYQNPLTRLTGGSATSASIGGALSTTNGTSGQDAVLPDGGSSNAGEAICSSASSGVELRVQRRGYPLSTVILVGLVAFLIGSLLRSLLSPADFIHVVTDVAEAEGTNSVGEWREIRRLFELKYFVGGWDFQVAVVRRHLT